MGSEVSEKPPVGICRMKKLDKTHPVVLITLQENRGISDRQREIINNQSWSIIWDGIEVFLPTTCTISVQTTSLRPGVAFSSSIILSISELFFKIVSTLRSMVCYPMLLPT